MVGSIDKGGGLYRRILNFSHDGQPLISRGIKRGSSVSGLNVDYLSEFFSKPDMTLKMEVSNVRVRVLEHGAHSAVALDIYRAIFLFATLS